MACRCCRRRPVVCSWWGWVLTPATFVLFFLAIGPTLNYGILFVSLKEEFGTSETVTGWLGATAGAVANIGGPLAARLGRSLGQRLVVLLGVCLNSLGLLATSFVPSIGYAYLTYGVLAGLGANFMVQPAMVLLMDWFHTKNFPRSSAIAQCGSSCGMLVFSPLLTAWISRSGWRSALRILGAVVAGLGFSAGLTMSAPPPPPAPGGERSSSLRGQRAAAPAEGDRPTCPSLALRPDRAETTDGARESESEREEEEEGQEPPRAGGRGELEAPGKSDELDGPVSHHHHHHHHQANRRPGLLRMLRDWDVVLWCLGIAASSISWSFFLVNFASFMDELGLSSDQIAMVLSCFGAGDLGGKVVVAVLGDRLPFRYVYVIAVSMAMGSAMAGILAVARGYLQMVFLSLASGLVHAGLNATLFAAGSQLFRAAYGSDDVMTASLIPFGVGKLISAPLSGGLYDVLGDYTVSLIVIAAIFVFAGLAFLLVPLRRRLLSSRGSHHQPLPPPVHL